MSLNNWAMLAVNYDSIDYLPYPVLVQPKLNGVRAMWHGPNKLLVSRQGKIFKKEVLPDIYDNLIRHYPNIIFDGELYHKDLPFQDICGAVGIRQLGPGINSAKIEYHVFDIINKAPTQKRLDDISMYHPYVGSIMVNSAVELDFALREYIKLGYEGLMIRLPGVPYIPGRTNALIKLKPWAYMTVTARSLIEGTGKFFNSLGAIVVSADNKTFKVGGGLISHQQREHIWQNPDQYLNRKLLIRYRELSKNMIPLQGQFISFC